VSYTCVEIVAIALSVPAPAENGVGFLVPFTVCITVGDGTDCTCPEGSSCRTFMGFNSDFNPLGGLSLCIVPE